MTKDEALDLALEALEQLRTPLRINTALDAYDVGRAITAIKQARALDKKAENARELGLDYEPVATLFGSLPVYDITPPAAQPAPVPLTEKELRKMYHEDQFGLFCDFDEFEQIVRATEQSHGITEKGQP